MQYLFWQILLNFSFKRIVHVPHCVGVPGSPRPLITLGIIKFFHLCQYEGEKWVSHLIFNYLWQFEHLNFSVKCSLISFAQFFVLYIKNIHLKVFFLLLFIFCTLFSLYKLLKGIRFDWESTGNFTACCKCSIFWFGSEYFCKILLSCPFKTKFYSKLYIKTLKN